MSRLDFGIIVGLNDEDDPPPSMQAMQTTNDVADEQPTERQNDVEGLHSPSSVLIHEVGAGTDDRPVRGDHVVASVLEATVREPVPR